MKTNSNGPAPAMSPWGAVDWQKEIAPGLVEVTTPSHGGYWLSRERWQLLRARFPKSTSYGGDCWLEEDCDWALAPLTFPELFQDRNLFYAVRTVRGSGDYFSEAAAWLAAGEVSMFPESSAAAVILKRAAAFAASVAELWERGSMSSGASIGGGWQVWFTRGAERRTVIMEYPEKSHYTTAELDEIDAQRRAYETERKAPAPVRAVVTRAVAEAFGMDKLPASLVQIVPDQTRSAQFDDDYRGDNCGL